MGNQQSISDNISKVINKSMTDILFSSSSSCSQNTESVQMINISGITAGQYCTLSIKDLNQSSVQAPNLACAISTDNAVSLQTSFEALLKQAADAEVSGLSGAVNSQAISKSLSELINTVSSRINVTSVASSIQNTISSNSASLTDISSGCPAVCGNPNIVPPKGTCEIIIENISQSIIQEAVSKLVSSNKTVADQIYKTSTVIDQETKSSNKGITLPDIFGIIIIIAVGCIFFFWNSITSLLKYILPISIIVCAGLSIYYGMDKKYTEMGISISLTIIIIIVTIIKRSIIF